MFPLVVDEVAVAVITSPAVTAALMATLLNVALPLALVVTVVEPRKRLACRELKFPWALRKTESALQSYLQASSANHSLSRLIHWSWQLKAPECFADCSRQYHRLAYRWL